MNFEAIKSAAEGYKADMSRFLRAMISHPSESCEEKDVVMCLSLIHIWLLCIPVLKSTIRRPVSSNFQNLVRGCAVIGAVPHL